MKTQKTLAQDENHGQIGGLNKSGAHFARPSGPDILSRTESFAKWRDARIEADVWPYSRTMFGPPQSSVTVRSEAGKTVEGVNFACTDYLSLASHQAIIEAGVRALKTYGPHSTCSPMLQGNTDLSQELEQAVAETLRMDHVVLFSTGWAAGFGSISGLVRPNDHIILDHLAHGCLQQGAHASTQNIRRHEHLNVDAAREHLSEIRSTDTKNGILVVSEGLFSMDSDYPDLVRLQEVCHEFDATLLVDIAHDFGSMGPGGTGLIGIQKMLGKIDLVMGAFSKTFATNGGFLATHSGAVKNFVKAFSGSHIFSTALSPVQAGVALEALRIVRSVEGDALRELLSRNVNRLRGEIASLGVCSMGDPSPIVPVPIGNEKIARVASGILFDRGVFANLVEFPAVAVGGARFRMQCMAAHSDEDIRTAARTVVESVHEASDVLYGDGQPFALVGQAEAGVA